MTLQHADGELRFTVHDTGSGFDTAVVAPGAGLTNVRDRIETVGGRVDVVSAAGRGTTVSGVVPWPTARLGRARGNAGPGPRSRSATDRSGGRTERGGFDASPATEPADHPLGTMPGRSPPP